MELMIIAVDRDKNEENMKEMLFIMSENVLTLTNDNFEKEVLQSDKPVLVDFGLHGVVPAEWLHP